jgi:hypothetical protein
MAKFTSPLDHVKVAVLCPADWSQMYGDGRVRFCSECKLNVYNLSAMKREEAEALLMSTEGRLCVRLYRRADGTIITQDCPVGLQAIKRQVKRAADAALWMVLSLISGMGLFSLVLARPRLPDTFQGALVMPAGLVGPAPTQGAIRPKAEIGKMEPRPGDAAPRRKPAQRKGRRRDSQESAPHLRLPPSS